MAEDKQPKKGTFLPWIPPIVTTVSTVFSIGLLYGTFKDIPGKVSDLENSVTALERSVSSMCAVVRVNYKRTTPRRSRIDFICSPYESLHTVNEP